MGGALLVFIGWHGVEADARRSFQILVKLDQLLVFHSDGNLPRIQDIRNLSLLGIEGTRARTECAGGVRRLCFLAHSTGIWDRAGTGWHTATRGLRIVSKRALHKEKEKGSSKKKEKEKERYDIENQISFPMLHYSRTSIH